MYISNERIRERVVLGVCFLYTIAFAIHVIVFGWNINIVPIITAGPLICIFLYFKRIRDYQFRVIVTAFVMWFNITVYMTFVDSFIPSLAIVSSMIVLISIYGHKKITYISFAFVTCNLVYHYFFKRDFKIEFSQSGITDILYIVAVYVNLIITHWLIQNQRKSDRIMTENIEAIKSAEQSKDDFMANMSHEIRTPINTVYGISEMLLNEELPENVSQQIYDIQRASRQLLNLASDILDFSELSTGKIEIVPDVYNITSTVNDILNMALAAADGKNIELIADCDPNIPRELIGDELKIRRAIFNIVDNAVKFTEEGGIVLTVAFRKESYGGNLIVTIEDTGIGMTKESLETIYSKYNQVDTKRNRKNTGLGLGIAVTKYIVKAMGGFLTIRSEYGQGTYVRISIPQKVSNPDPIATISDHDIKNVMIYMDTDRYNKPLIREGYVNCMKNIVDGLGVNYRILRTLAELKRRIVKDRASFLFITWEKYNEDRQYFEDLSQTLKVVLILERNHKESVLGSNLLCVYKPFYVLTIASVLNGTYVEYVSHIKTSAARFTAPDAKVLVVDDNIMNLRVCEGLLRPYRMKIFVAESGREALGLMDTEQFDLIFMDHMMPEMDGIETYRRIRQKKGTYYRDVPVVALTANAIAGAREMFINEGFSDYISKPIEVSQLDRVLSRLLPEYKKKYDYDIEESHLTEDTEQVDKELEIKGVDVKKGLGYVRNNLNDYIDILRTYVRVAPKHIEDVRRTLDEQNKKDYITFVHGIKSISYGIGATSLGDMAFRLEKAGKEDDTDYIFSHTEEMLKTYQETVEYILQNKTLFPLSDNHSENTQDLKEIDIETLILKLDNLAGLLDNFRQDEALDCLKELSEYRYLEKPLSGMLESVRNETEDYNYDEAKRLAKELIEELS